MNFYSHNVADFAGEVRIHKLPMVYVLATPSFEFIKIGSTKSVKQRISNIQSCCPFPLSLWLAIRTPRHVEVEQCLHRLMGECHFRGEWFKPGSGDLTFLESYFNETNRHISEVCHALL